VCLSPGCSWPPAYCILPMVPYRNETVATNRTLSVRQMGPLGPARHISLIGCDERRRGFSLATGYRHNADHGFSVLSSDAVGALLAAPVSEPCPGSAGYP
jgi:hypothetical protein